MGEAKTLRVFGKLLTELYIQKSAQLYDFPQTKHPMYLVPISRNNTLSAS